MEVHLIYLMYPHCVTNHGCHQLILFCAPEVQLCCLHSFLKNRPEKHNLFYLSSVTIINHTSRIQKPLLADFMRLKPIDWHPCLQ